MSLPVLSFEPNARVTYLIMNRPQCRVKAIDESRLMRAFNVSSDKAHFSQKGDILAGCN
jgi:hypothetical protein